MQGKVEICGVNTSKLKVLKNEETMELLRRTKEGDMEAREQLIAGNLRLVLSVIQKFSNRGENLDDLFQVGCIGLIKAIDNFNTDLDVRFSTYGVPMIIGEIRRYLRDNSSVRVSRSMRDTAYKVLQVRDKYLAENQREPTVEQIAQEGAIQIFQEHQAGFAEIIVGVVGTLQFDVLKYRLENEYNCEIRLEPLPYQAIRWIKDVQTDMNKLKGVAEVKKVRDMRGNPLLLFKNEWGIQFVLDRNEGLELVEFSKE